MTSELLIAARAVVAPADGLLLEPGQLPPGPGWLRLRGLVAEASTLNEWLDGTGDAHGGVDVAASYLSNWLAWPLARLLVAPALDSGRSLGVPPDAVWVRRRPVGPVTAVAVVASTLIVAEGDPLAGLAGVVVRPTAADVRATALRRLVATLTPAVDALTQLSHRGSHALWGGVVDACAQLLVDAEPSMSREEVEASVEELLAPVDPPLRGRPQVLDTPAPHDSAPALAFSVCCLGDKDPVRANTLCAGCPKQTREELIDRLVP
jgi:hypothetical protein